MRKTDLHIGQEVCYQGQCAIVLAIGGWEFAFNAGYIQNKQGDRIALAHNIFEDNWIPTLARTADIKCTWVEWQKERQEKSVRSANIDRVLEKAKEFGLPFIRNALEEMNDNANNFAKVQSF